MRSMSNSASPNGSSWAASFFPFCWLVTLRLACATAEVHQLGYEGYKAKQVIDSRDISYAFTNLMANDYYSFSQIHHCLEKYADVAQRITTIFAYSATLTARQRRRTTSRSGSSSLSKIGNGFCLQTDRDNLSMLSFCTHSRTPTVSVLLWMLLKFD